MCWRVKCRDRNYSCVNEFFILVLFQSFSSIVGPNGSGKSNVIDSMLFVFGYRASKIRSKKLSVLIHNSEKYKNVNSCTVSVYFQKIIDTGVCTRAHRHTQILKCTVSLGTLKKLLFTFTNRPIFES